MLPWYEWDVIFCSQQHILFINALKYKNYDNKETLILIYFLVEKEENFLKIISNMENEWPSFNYQSHDGIYLHKCQMFLCLIKNIIKNIAYFKEAIETIILI